jgi:hypothetical protein
MDIPDYYRLVTFPLLLILSAAIAPTTPAAAADAETGVKYRQWIMEMKTAERGPFSRLRWFCKDGAVLPPPALWLRRA